jgi:hypothetical protein
MKGGLGGMGMGPVVSEEIRVPDKMVGLSKFNYFNSIYVYA